MRRIDRLRFTGYSVLIFVGALALTTVGLEGRVDRDRQAAPTVEPLPGLALDLSVNWRDELLRALKDLEKGITAALFRSLGCTQRRLRHRVLMKDTSPEIVQ